MIIEPPTAPTILSFSLVLDLLSTAYAPLKIEQNSPPANYISEHSETKKEDMVLLLDLPAHYISRHAKTGRGVFPLPSVRAFFCDAGTRKFISCDTIRWQSPIPPPPAKESGQREAEYPS